MKFNDLKRLALSDKKINQNPKGKTFEMGVG